MLSFNWNQILNEWSGTCPRCGIMGFFPIRSTTGFAGHSLDILFCPSQHMFVAEYYENDKNAFIAIHPKEWIEPIPTWLPSDFNNCFKELL